MNAIDPFPFGVPVNRQKPKSMTPVTGRPNWFRDKDGVERYVEPPRPVVPGSIFELYGVAPPSGI